MKKKTIASHCSASASVLSQQYIDYVNCKTSMLNKMFVHIHYRLHDLKYALFFRYTCKRTKQTKQEKNKRKIKCIDECTCRRFFFLWKFYAHLPILSFISSAYEYIPKWSRFIHSYLCVCVFAFLLLLCSFLCVFSGKLLFSFDNFLLLL